MNDEKIEVPGGKEIGEMLRERRLSRELELEELAARLKLSAETIRQREMGNKLEGVISIARHLAELGCELRVRVVSCRLVSGPRK